MTDLAEREHTNRCRAAVLRAGANTLERKAAVMLKEAADNRALADRLSPRPATPDPVFGIFGPDGPNGKAE